MTANSVTKLTTSLLALIAVLAISTKLAQAQLETGGSPPHTDAGPSTLFQNLVTDETALAAWNHIGGQQAEVNCDGLPLGEFTQRTCNLLSNQFDIIWPGDDRDPNKINLKMRLKDVRAIEIFNAMNLFFEAQTIPAHWKLTLNGTRPTAILMMKKPQISSTSAVEPERKHTVFSIGDTLFKVSPAQYKQSAAKLAEALEAVLDDISDKPRRGPSGGLREGAPVFQIHPEAGILVFTGTAEETQLVRSTLEAMNDASLRKEDSLAREQKANLDGEPKLK